MHSLQQRPCFVHAASCHTLLTQTTVSKRCVHTVWQWDFAGMDQGSFENNVQDWMNDGFASGWPSASDTNGMTFNITACAL